MKKITAKILTYALVLLLASCGINSNYVYLIDRNPAPNGQANRLVLNSWRGDYGMVSSATNHNPNDLKFKIDRERFRKENGSKKWILENWGTPDSSQIEGGVTYYTYSQKSKLAPNYDKQFMFGERPVKLGFRGERLVEIQAYFSDRGYKGQQVVVLP
jgi:hypothetical protein